MLEMVYTNLYTIKFRERIMELLDRSLGALISLECYLSFDAILIERTHDVLNIRG